MINSKVNGNTQVLGIIGNPVKHSISPIIQNAIAEKLGDNYIYAPFHVENGFVEDAVKGAYALNIKGLNVTMPHKQAVLPHLCALDKGAEAVGAVNTLKYTEHGYVGYNTDMIGVMNTLRSADMDMRGKTAAILGAGGGARAAAVALSELGAKKLYIVNRNLSAAETLAKNIQLHYDIPLACLAYKDIELIKDAAAIIQTTTVGFGDQAHLSPVTDLTVFDHQLFVLDIIYAPRETVFLKNARACGCKAVNGFDMLFYQAIAAYEIWTDKALDETFVANFKQELSAFFYEH
jgi:shikimate dehydrogenase